MRSTILSACAIARHGGRVQRPRLRLFVCTAIRACKFAQAQKQVCTYQMTLLLQRNLWLSRGLRAHVSTPQVQG